MSQNTPLANVVAMLKVELGYNLTSGTATADDIALAALVAKKQRFLADSFDWPYFETRWDVQVAAGDRYLSLPTLNTMGANATLNFKRPVLLETFWPNWWKQVFYGISQNEYNWRNSDKNPPDVLDPVQKWRRIDLNKFEIWPVAAGTQKLRFTGQRLPVDIVTFTGASGPSTINIDWDGLVEMDDELVILFTAAEKLQLMGKSNAASVASRANALLRDIRGGQPDDEESCAMNSGKRRENIKRLVPVKNLLVASDSSPTFDNSNITF